MTRGSISRVFDVHVLAAAAHRSALSLLPPPCPCGAWLRHDGRGSSRSLVRRAHVRSSRTCVPRFSKSRGSAGARRPPSDFVTSRQSSGARVRWSCQAEGATTASTSFGSRPTAFRAPGYHRPRPLAAALLIEAGAPLTKGVRASHCWGSPGLDRRPRNLRRAFSSRQTHERKTRLPQPGTDLTPLQTLSCCVPRTGQGARSMGVAERAGISFCF